ncbi:MAG TPA: hypothetical protein PL163_17435, partial [Leptospiraceae bacterium]|nr:hypothetical protein [Leptospiraceae bacterium]
TKEDIAPLLEKHPEIYNNVKQVSNQRKENLQTKKQEAMYVPPPKQESLMTRLKRKIYGTLGLLKEIEELHTEEPPKEEKKA